MSTTNWFSTPVLGTAELCGRLGVHGNTVAGWRKNGLPAYPAGSALVYKWDEVATWLAHNNRVGYVMRANARKLDAASSRVVGRRATPE